MALTRSGVGYDRSRILEAAARARSKKQRSRAIELYRWVLAIEPQSQEIHAKLGPLLAETGQHFDAWNSFRIVARGQLRTGHPDQALATYREAALYLPQEVQAWQTIGRLQAKRGQRAEAVETLLEGSRQFRTRWLRPQAIHLLRLARDLDPWNFEVVLELACMLAIQQQEREAQLLLDGLVARYGGDRLQRVRAAQLRFRPSPGAAWRWLESLLRPAPEPSPSLETLLPPARESDATLETLLPGPPAPPQRRETLLPAEPDPARSREARRPAGVVSLKAVSSRRA
jgi:tetratricopeptide (TPR) repeat protein